MRPRAALLALALSIGASQGAAQSIVAIRGVTVIDGTGTPPQANRTVIIRNDRIAAIGPAGTTALPRGARVIDARGLYVVPGFIDVHAHYALGPISIDRTKTPNTLRMVYDHASAIESLKTLLGFGITTIRNPGGPTEQSVAVRDSVRMGLIRGPRIFTAGEVIDATSAEEGRRDATTYPNERRQLMSADLEAAWQAVGVTWRTDEHRAPTSTDYLAQRVRRQSDRLRLIVVGEVVLTLAMLVVSGAVIVRNAGSSPKSVGLMVVLYTAAVWAFALWNRRGIWSRYGETTADFVALLRVRAQRRIRSAWFSQLVISVAVILVAREIDGARLRGEVTLVGWVWIALGAYSVAVILWSTWYRLQAKREIRELDALALDLAQPEETRRVAD